MTPRNIWNKAKIVTNCLYGNIKIFPYFLFGPLGIKPIISSRNDSPQLIVSLTSYGRRVKKTVYYTIISILNQSYRPDRIILWLDKSWNIDNLPPRLKALMQKGLEIKFCNDILSYKKLIPTLNIAQNDIIITIDDDVYYSKNIIKLLYSNYLIHPQGIHCTQALFVEKKDDGTFLPYKTWKRANTYDEKDSYRLFPIGEGGILYPPASLYKDVIQRDLFQKLCPYADDVWFWFMAKLNNRQHYLVSNKKMYYSFDALYQFFHKGTALTHSNKRENRNDIQMMNVLKYYSHLISNCNNKLHLYI